VRIAVAALCLAVVAGCVQGPRTGDRRAAFIGNVGEPSAVIAAELAFAREARDKGTWTAFRDTAASDAIWPGPSWESVQAALKGVPDPAPPIVWEPDQVWVSCDGSYALSTGPATHPGGRKSRFATIWQRQGDGGYKWVLDQGFDLDAGYDKPEMIAARIAECPKGRRPPRQPARRGLPWQSGQSDDGTLAWITELRPDCSRELVVRALRGEGMEEVFRRTSSAPQAVGSGPQPVCD
jgi:hypothetical protein